MYTWAVARNFHFFEKLVLEPLKFAVRLIFMRRFHFCCQISKIMCERCVKNEVWWISGDFAYNPPTGCVWVISRKKMNGRRCFPTTNVDLDTNRMRCALHPSQPLCVTTNKQKIQIRSKMFENEIVLKTASAFEHVMFKMSISCSQNVHCFGRIQRN